MHGKCSITWKSAFNFWNWSYSFCACCNAHGNGYHSKCAQRNVCDSVTSGGCAKGMVSSSKPIIFYKTSLEYDCVRNIKNSHLVYIHISSRSATTTLNERYHKTAYDKIPCKQSHKITSVHLDSGWQIFTDIPWMTNCLNNSPRA